VPPQLNQGESELIATMGKRFECPDMGGQYMVTKGGDAELSCDGTSEAEPNRLGKRYLDEATAVTVLCIKAGTGRVCCNGVPMTEMAQKKLPSSD
jgi:hypothetical protein